MGPFLKSENKTNKMMFHLLISILPIVLFAIYKNGKCMRKSSRIPKWYQDVEKE